VPAALLKQIFLPPVTGQIENDVYSQNRAGHAHRLSAKNAILIVGVRQGAVRERKTPCGLPRRSKKKKGTGSDYGLFSMTSFALFWGLRGPFRTVRCRLGGRKSHQGTTVESAGGSASGDRHFSRARHFTWWREEKWSGAAKSALRGALPQQLPTPRRRTEMNYLQEWRERKNGQPRGAPMKN